MNILDDMGVSKLSGKLHFFALKEAEGRIFENALSCCNLCCIRLKNEKLELYTRLESRVII